MKQIFMLLVVTGVVTICRPAVSFSEQVIIPIDQQRFFQASSSANITIKPKGLVQVIEEAHGIRIKPKLVGEASMTIDGHLTELQLVSPDTTLFLKPVEDFLITRMGLKTDLQDGQLVIQGQLHRVRDWMELANLSSQLNGDYQFRANVDQDLIERLTKTFSKILAENAVRSYQIQFEPYPRILLTKIEEEELGRIRQSLKRYGLEVTPSGTLVKVEPMVQIKVTVAEVSRSAQEDLGINWPSEASFQISPKVLTEQNLFVTLKASVEKGDAQILASPRLVAKSGGTAEFLAGGEFPIRISDRGRKDIFWKRHGIFLKIMPKADLQRHLQLDVTAEISMPEASYEGESIPALKTNRVSSQFDLKAPRTIVLSGLVQDLRSNTTSGILGLSQLPVLGKLFQSKGFQSHQTELVIFVTPEIVDPDIIQEPQMPSGWSKDVSLNQ